MMAKNKKNQQAKLKVKKQIKNIIKNLSIKDDSKDSVSMSEYWQRIKRDPKKEARFLLFNLNVMKVNTYLFIYGAISIVIWAVLTFHSGILTEVNARESIDSLNNYGRSLACIQEKQDECLSTIKEEMVLYREPERIEIIKRFDYKKPATEKLYQRDLMPVLLDVKIYDAKYKSNGDVEELKKIEKDRKIYDDIIAKNNELISSVKSNVDGFLHNGLFIIFLGFLMPAINLFVNKKECIALKEHKKAKKREETLMHRDMFNIK